MGVFYLLREAGRRRGELTPASSSSFLFSQICFLLSGRIGREKKARGFVFPFWDELVLGKMELCAVHCSFLRSPFFSPGCPAGDRGLRSLSFLFFDRDFFFQLSPYFHMVAEGRSQWTACTREEGTTNCFFSPFPLPPSLLASFGHQSDQKASNHFPVE